MNSSDYKKGQSVVAHLYTQGPWRICIPVVVVRKLKNGNWQVEDQSGKRVEMPPQSIFPSQEAFEASIKALAVAVNTQTGRITEFK
jgi:hypothetical protein